MSGKSMQVALLVSHFAFAQHWRHAIACIFPQDIRPHPRNTSFSVFSYRLNIPRWLLLWSSLHLPSPSTIRTPSMLDPRRCSVHHRCSYSNRHKWTCWNDLWRSRPDWAWCRELVSCRASLYLRVRPTGSPR